MFVSAALAEAPPSGEELFSRKWVAYDARAAGGDGLGPMHNETSCAGCHLQGGVGGGGGLDKNVDLVSLVPPEALKDREEFRQRVAKVHPGFEGGNVRTLLLHRFGPEADYQDWRTQFFGVDKGLVAQALSLRPASATRGVDRMRPAWSAPVIAFSIEGVDLRLSHRNTTALFGAGLIDAIKEETLIELALDQARRKDDITGRVSPASGGVGRFGWRGQTSRLADFVQLACANELGLQVNRTPQALNPRATHHKSVGNDMNEDEVVALTGFIARLPSPGRDIPANRKTAQEIANGERLFESVGCSACHVTNVGDAKGIYSDLLLHDMGDGLSDPAPSHPIMPSSDERRLFKATYNGQSSAFENLDAELMREWRTPPLWGLRDSAPYLHDGRAATIDEAIRLHGGEAALAVKKYSELSEKHRVKVTAFLHSLAAPTTTVKQPAPAP